MSSEWTHREWMSHFINRSIAILFSPYGVALTALVFSAGHLYLTLTGQIPNLLTHWWLGMGEWAIVVGGMVGHSTLVSGKADAVQQSAIIRALPGVDDTLAAAQKLPESDLERLERELSDVQSSEPQ